MLKNVDIFFFMLTEFITTWYEETIKWLDSVTKVMASESAYNKDLLTKWIKEDIEIMQNAMEPLATFSSNSKELVASVRLELVERLNKCGLSL